MQTTHVFGSAGGTEDPVLSQRAQGLWQHRGGAPRSPRVVRGGFLEEAVAQTDRRQEVSGAYLDLFAIELYSYT